LGSNRRILLCVLDAFAFKTLFAVSAVRAVFKQNFSTHQNRDKPVTDPVQPNTRSIPHLIACASLIALIVLSICWEWFLAPLHPGGSSLVLKALPLLLPLRGILKRDNYTMQWSSMAIFIYFTEGVVRATSDQFWLSQLLACVEIALCTAFFTGVVLYLRPYKIAAKKLKAIQKTNEA
jgi:uncharacterized membrane protein